MLVLARERGLGVAEVARLDGAVSCAQGGSVSKLSCSATAAVRTRTSGLGRRCIERKRVRTWRGRPRDVEVAADVL